MFLFTLFNVATRNCFLKGKYVVCIVALIIFLLGGAGDTHWFPGHRAGLDPCWPLTNWWSELGLSSDSGNLKSRSFTSTKLSSWRQWQNILRNSFMDMTPEEESFILTPPLTQSL